MQLQNKTIAVTGASGMIGVYLCRSLMRAGAKVIGVVRNPEKAAFLAQEGVTFRKADLRDTQSLAQAFAGCDAIVANAAMYITTKMLSDWPAHERANVEGTQNVFDAAKLAGVKRLVQVSTFGIYKFSILHPLNEASPQLDGARRQGGPYRGSKQISETLAWQLAQQHSLDLTTLRPSGVFGARDDNFMRKVYPLLKLPALVLPSICFPLVYAGDVADAAVGALSNDQSIGQAYNVGGMDRQFSTFVSTLVTAYGRGPKVLALPMPIHVRVDSGKAERDLGFKHLPLADAFKAILAEDPPRR